MKLLKQKRYGRETEHALTKPGAASQVWVGGAPGLTRVGYTYADKVKMETMDDFLRPLFGAFKAQRRGAESFGDFAHRVGKEQLQELASSYKA
jgi:sulfite reductase (ferredoxin)